MRKLVIGTIAISAAILLILFYSYFILVAQQQDAALNFSLFAAMIVLAVVLPLTVYKLTRYSGRLKDENNQLNILLAERLDDLKKSQANLYTIFDSTDTIYFLLDDDFKLISYNQRAKEFCLDELKKDVTRIESDFIQYFCLDRKPPLREWLNQCLPGSFVIYETNYVQPDKSVHWYVVKKFPIFDAERNRIGLMVALSDNTAQKLMEQEIVDKEVQGQKTIIREILKAQENERNKIGQELHDNVNQILVSAKLYLNMAYSDHPNNLEFIRTCISFLDEAVSEIRKLSSKEVTPIKQIELQELIHYSIESIHQHSGIKTNLTYKIPETRRIEDDLKLNLYRIVQEQLNNILKHAKASTINVHVEEKNGSIVMGISDNGIGFDQTQNRKGIGISNIINRVKSYNGEVAIISAPMKGCQINIQIPVP